MLKPSHLPACVSLVSILMVSPTYANECNFVIDNQSTAVIKYNQNNMKIQPQTMPVKLSKSEAAPISISCSSTQRGYMPLACRQYKNNEGMAFFQTTNCNVRLVIDIVDGKFNVQEQLLSSS